ncbi:hypothetical protein FDB14_17455 [Clostridium botulinum]|nr:hypothetical protein [Clostridium botulinum]NFK69441.1 hypothetical protein [Clostridium botulinum]NFK97951.1 hypothetical protein [Clostridium botulinum]
MGKYKNYINKYNMDLKKAENIVVNTEGIIIGTNADDTDDGLAEMCILIADNRPAKYLKCVIVENKKIFILSREEENRIDNELKEYY